MIEDRKEVFFYRIFALPSNVDIDSLLKTLKTHQNKEIILQIFNPEFIVSNKQIQAAIYATNKVFDSGRNIAREKANEFLLRLSGKRQITSALDILGISERSINILILSFGGSEKENIARIDQFLKLSNISEKNEIKKSVPLTDLEILQEHYQVTGSIEEIEKKALENIASVEIL
ncbi:MAG: KEOPS complex subunit Cgi121 [Candidatus Heimdallarchaeaceae archaeon]|jgi:tRNA threonylcarbamoyladenosine modification (KEOPS) complex Cgi121 subunit